MKQEQKYTGQQLNTPEANAKKGLRYDWDTISEDYVTSNMTIQDISDKYHVGYKSVAKHCRDDGWVKRREKYRKDVSKETIKRATKKASKERADILKSVLTSAANSAEIISCKIADPEEDMTALQLKQYLESLKIIEDMARSIQGILTEPQKRKLKLEEDRLNIEKQKVEQKEPDKNINITIQGYEEEWSE